MRSNEELYRVGLTCNFNYAEIARQVGLCREAVRLRFENIPHAKHETINVEQLYALVELGCTFDEIASETELNHYTLRRHLRELELKPTKKQKREAEQRMPLPEVAEKLERMTWKEIAKHYGVSMMTVARKSRKIKQGAIA